MSAPTGVVSRRVTLRAARSRTWYWPPWRGRERGPLTRFFLAHCRLFGIYVHRINGPDLDDECHDHPWSFVSLVLAGWYDELILSRQGLFSIVRRRRFSIAFRHRTAAHKIISTSSTRPTWTLVIRFRNHEEWGFYHELPPGTRWFKWMPWDGRDGKGQIQRPDGVAA